MIAALHRPIPFAQTPVSALGTMGLYRVAEITRVDLAWFTNATAASS